VFKRRNPKTYLRMIADIVYPKGGWSRAVSYVLHRLRRLPDPPHRIARGVAAGVFVCFTPLYGLHFVLATMLALAMQGNIIAALLATFFGNPITFPIIAAVSMELGSWMLGQHHMIALSEVFEAFRDASVQLWANFTAIFTPETAHWDKLAIFFDNVFWPYFVGGLIPGVVTGVSAYMLARPAVSAYQKARIKRLKARYQKRRATSLSKG
jgi:uncharacterized protein (DUF2062 family)